MNEFEFVRRSRGYALLFPGQGSQHVGMGQELFNAYPVAKATFEETDDILGYALSRLCFEGPEDELTNTVNAQPALLTASIATLRALASELGDASLVAGDGQTSVVAGHSMGEYSALVAAGALSFADALRLVHTRGRLMKNAGENSPGMMAAVLGLDEAQVAAVCSEVTAAGGVAQVANDNCPGQVVISGDKKGMAAAMEALSTAGAKKILPLAVSIAAHSPLMLPAAGKLSEVIDAVSIIAPAVPVIGNTNAIPLTTEQGIRSELNAQLTGSVRWAASIQAAAMLGVATYVEVGPGEVLTGLVKRIDRKAARFSINTPATLAAFVSAAMQSQHD